MWEQRSAGGGTWKHRELRSEGGTAGREVVLLEWEGGGRGRRKKGNGMEVKVSELIQEGSGVQMEYHGCHSCSLGTMSVQTKPCTDSWADLS